jgi:hypothetical protein
VRRVGEWEEPERVAAAVAPHIDRLRLVIARSMGARAGDVSEQTGIPAAALPLLSMLRNTMPDRAVEIDDVLEVFVYTPPGSVRESLEQLIDAAAIERVAGSRVRLAGVGRDVVIWMRAQIQDLLSGLWAGHDELVARTLPLVERAYEAAMADGGPTLRVVSPVVDPVDASPAVRLAERLTPLRFHRFEAHAGAWRSEGLTAEQAQALESGPLRDRIEAETNRLAAPPYAALDPRQRTMLQEGLAGLPSGEQ